jgi:hypothetical protein
MMRYVLFRAVCCSWGRDPGAHVGHAQIDPRRLAIPLSALLVAVILTAAALVRPAIAQTLTGTISGEVKTTDGRSLPGATVELSGPLHLKTMSEPGGTFEFRNLPVGIYSVKVDKTGFVSASQSDVVIAAGSSATAQISLNPASGNGARKLTPFRRSGTDPQGVNFSCRRCFSRGSDGP